jgi:3-methyladenine DNA glycosylase AlkD
MAKRFCMTIDTILSELRTLANPANVAGMARYGINPTNTLGVPIPPIREMARRAKKEHTSAERHALAQELWSSGVHEARLLAGFIDDPKCVTEKQMESWAVDFDSWDICDQVCSNLFDKTPFAYDKAAQWSARPAEFVKRAGFVLMAALAVHDKKANDAAFLQFLPIIIREAGDQRNFVKKAVNWALRQIGKRNAALNRAALTVIKEILQLDNKAARWIASDAWRELTSDAVQVRLKK